MSICNSYLYVSAKSLIFPQQEPPFQLNPFKY